MGEPAIEIGGSDGMSERPHRNAPIGAGALLRDPEAVRAFEDRVIGPLVGSKIDGEEVRVWVPACATGEGAYGIAMLILDALGRPEMPCPVHVFATDIDETALQVGRQGLVSADSLPGLGDDRLRRFFRRVGDAFRPNRRLREALVFARQDVLRDPPFSRLDLIVCQTVPRTLTPQALDRLAERFHFGLRPGGYLILGGTGAAGHAETLFEPVDDRIALFRRKSLSESASLHPDVDRRDDRLHRAGVSPPPDPTDALRLRSLVQQELLRKFTPAAVLVDGAGQPLYASGPTERYLSDTADPSDGTILQLVREALRSPLRELLERTGSGGDIASSAIVDLMDAAGDASVRLTVSQTADPDRSEILFLVTFEEVRPSSIGLSRPPEAEGATADEQLMSDLRTARDEVGTWRREVDLVHEQLQLANEELMAVNEELQSTNEELKTSTEDLRSMNEDLLETVEQLSGLTDDLRNFEAGTGIAAIVLDSGRRIGRFTPATRALFSVIPSDVGRPLTDIRQNFEDPALYEDIRHVEATQEMREREIVTGEGAWYLRRILPYRTLDGRTAGVVITFFDVTLRHETERKLRESEVRFRALILNAPDPMILINATGSILLANTQALKLFGYETTELIGASVETIIPRRLRHVYEVNRDGLLRQPRVRRMGQAMDLAAVTRDGTEVPVEVTLSPVAGAEGDLVIAAIRDVGRIRRAVREAQDARRMSDSALRAKSRFLATASHDLRQPLQSLSQSTEALVRMVSDPPARRLLEMQGASISSMRSLLNSLLDISKLDANGVIPQIQPVKLRPILDAVRDELQAEAGEKGLSVRIDGGDLAVRSDHDLLRQLLQNILVNAVRYTDAGSVEVTVSRDGSRVVILIADTGRGMSASELPHVFEEFYRIESGRGERGLGLGLAIVRRIAAMLAIGIDVASEPGVGTTFTLTLEASDEAIAPAPAAAPAAPALAVGGTILLVDDEPSVLESTEAVIALEDGLDVVTAMSPEDAYAALARQVPDVLITDMHLGAAVSGLDVIREARRRAGRTIPAILVTGDTSGRTAGHGLADLVILTKPTESSAVIDAVRQFLARGAGAAPAPPGKGPA